MKHLDIEKYPGMEPQNFDKQMVSTKIDEQKFATDENFKSLNHKLILDNLCMKVKKKIPHIRMST